MRKFFVSMSGAFECTVYLMINKRREKFYRNKNPKTHNFKNVERFISMRNRILYYNQTKMENNNNNLFCHI